MASLLHPSILQCRRQQQHMMHKATAATTTTTSVLAPVRRRLCLQHRSEQARLRRRIYTKKKKKKKKKNTPGFVACCREGSKLSPKGNRITYYRHACHRIHPQTESAFPTTPCDTKKASGVRKVYHFFQGYSFFLVKIIKSTFSDIPGVITNDALVQRTPIGGRRGGEPRKQRTIIQTASATRGSPPGLG